MMTIKKFCTTHERLLLLMLLFLVAGFFSLHITTPLYDYDEATYAKVVVDTLASGNIFDLTLSGHAWFEKPPLYMWLSMGAVKIFSAKEFAFRLPGIMASIVCLFLIYFITKKLTGDVLSATISFLVLLFTPLFYSFAAQGQLDSSVLMCILAVVYFYIRGQSTEKYLFWIFPMVAIGFLYKSVITFLSIPILITFSVCYWQWSWLKNKFLWLGSIISLIIIIPWHLLETLRFGMTFWNNYIGRQVLQRATSTITGTSGYGDYVNGLFTSSPLWGWVLLALIAIYIGVYIRTKSEVRSISYRHMLAPLCSAFFILGLFSIARTHLPFYIMPIFPFIALFIGMLFHNLTSEENVLSYWALILVSCLIAIGIYYFWTPSFSVPFWGVTDEAVAGKMYRTQPEQLPLYAIGWPNLETLNYYADTKTIYREPELTPEALINGPFYAVMASSNLPIIFYKDINNTWKCRYGDLEILYYGPKLMLVYSSGNYPQL